MVLLVMASDRFLTTDRFTLCLYRWWIHCWIQLSSWRGWLNMPRFKLRRLKMLLSHKSNCRLKLKRRRYSWNLWTGVLWAEETARKHGQVGRGKREGRGEAASFTTLPWSLRKEPTFCDATTDFPLKCRLRSERRNSILMTSHYPDQVLLLVGRAACEICFNQSEAVPRSG